MKMYFCVSLLLLSVSLVSPAKAQLKRGDAAPDFSARTLDDEPIKLSDFKGKTLLIEMGTTWCPSCNEQARQIGEIRERLKEIEVIYLTVFLADSAKSVRSHLKIGGLEHPDQVMLDSGEARRNYGVFTIPRVLLIDKSFKVVFDKMVMSKDELLQQIDQHQARQ